MEDLKLSSTERSGLCYVAEPGGSPYAVDIMFTRRTAETLQKHGLVQLGYKKASDKTVPWCILTKEGLEQVNAIRASRKFAPLAMTEPAEGWYVGETAPTDAVLAAVAVSPK